MIEPIPTIDENLSDQENIDKFEAYIHRLIYVSDDTYIIENNIESEETNLVEMKSKLALIYQQLADIMSQISTTESNIRDYKLSLKYLKEEQKLNEINIQTANDILLQFKETCKEIK